MSLNSSSNRLAETVLGGGYCVGCGACAALDGSSFTMRLDPHGRLQAVADGGMVETDGIGMPYAAVCPFGEDAADEDELSATFLKGNRHRHRHIGQFFRVLAGYVADGDFRARGSSGGMATWMLTELLAQDLIDGVLHVGPVQPSERDPRLFKYKVSTTEDEVRAGAKSRYYPVEISEVIQLVRKRPGRYAFVGIPCFVKAVRLLALEDQLVSERIRYTISLVCGHLKTHQYSEFLAWQAGVPPKSLTSIDFRKKYEDRPASQYGIVVEGGDDGMRLKRTVPMAEIDGGDWGLGLFKYRACDFCDDVFGEMADVTVGDAWIDPYVEDPGGTNVVVVRNQDIDRVLRQGTRSGSLQLEPLDPQSAVQSQEAAIFHRWHALSYRLALEEKRGNWYPRKRVAPSSRSLNFRLRLKQKLRSALATRSHSAFHEAKMEGSLQVFEAALRPLGVLYRLVRRPMLSTFWVRLRRAFRR